MEAMSGRNRAFTLLEVLAAVTILVILGTMLFEVFGKSSDVVRISNARQDVFQYARSSLEFLEREIGAAFTSVDAVIATDGTNTGIKGMRVYNQSSMGSNCAKREGSQGIFLSAGIMARDTRQVVGNNPNPSYGKDVNVARIAYYLNNELNQLWKAAIYRTEMYDLTIGTPDTGGPFVRNCLSFNIQVTDPRFGYRLRTLDWNSDADANGNAAGRPRRGLPKAISISMRITDEQDAHQYVWGNDPASAANPKKWYIRGPDPAKDYWVDEDPVVQSFYQVIYFGRRSD